MATSANTSVKNVPAGNKVGTIGTVKLVVGEVTATDQGGVQRVLHEGDQVSANDVIQTSADGAVDIAFINNTHVDLGRDARIALDDSVFDPRQAATEQNDIAAIQAAIAAGADPTTLVPAPAAGAGAADEGGSSFVVVDQLAARGNVTSGFDTAGGFVAPPVPLVNGGLLPVVAAAAAIPPETPPVTPPEIPPVTPPITVNDVITTNEDTAVSGSVATNDTPGSAGGNVWAINAVASHGEVAFNPDGTYTYTPVANYNGPDSFSYNLTDANGNVSSAIVTVTVNPVNDAPVAVNDRFSTGQNLPLAGTSVLVNDTDVDGNALTARLVAQAQHGVVALSTDGTFTYKPTAGYHGPDSFTYQANDGVANSNIATVTIDVNATPVGTKEQYGVIQNGTLSVSAANGVLTNDTDVDSTALTAVLLRTALNGTLTLNPDGSFNYVPEPGYSGGDSFTYQPSDGITLGGRVLVSLFIDPLPPVVLAAMVTQVGTQVGTEPAVLSSFTDFNNGSAGGWVAHNTVTGTTGTVEINPESVYGGPSTTNRVLEVESAAGINSLQQSFETHKGTVYQVEVDFSTRDTAGAAGDNSTLQMLVNGTVIGVMPGGSSFATAHHIFSFAGSGGSDLVEFRALDGKVDAVGGLIDNIRLTQTASAYQDHAALLQPFTSVFSDVTDQGASHMIRLSGMPVGSTVTDGTAGHTFVTTAIGQTVEIFNPDHASAANWNLNTISVTAPEKYVGELQLTATESATSGGVATATHDFALSYGPTTFTGTAGVDIIHGTTANDIINGGPGDDILSGSLGTNTFVYRSGDLAAGAGGDHILDFKVGTASAAGDVLDISDLLSGHGISQSAFAGHEANFLQVTSTGGVTSIQFDAGGTAGASPLPLATLDGVGPGLTLNTLLDHGQIHAA